MSRFLPKPFRSFGRNIKVKVDLSNYATKADIKNISHVDTSSFALKTNLATLKIEVNKLANLITKTDFDAKLLSLNKKITHSK